MTPWNPKIMIFIRILTYLDSFWSAITGNWKRILIGAVLGWVVSLVIGAPLFVYLMFNINWSYETWNILGAAWTWALVGIGGIVGYATRSEDGRDTKSIETNS